MPLTILITGAHGQLGSELSRCLGTMMAEIGPLSPEYRNAQVVATDQGEMDITDEEATIALMEALRPDIVFNCAAMTNVDGCEQDEELAFRINAHGPANLARACAKTGARLIHVSTDYVFAGTDPAPRTEADPTNPASVYGASKLAGEQGVLDANPQACIVRTAWLYGYVGHNFVKTMRRLGQTHASVEVVDDQLGNPTSANDLAYMLLKLALGDLTGIFHCTNNGTCSWADFARAIMEGSHLACEVAPISSARYAAKHPQAASRPAYSSLSNERLAHTIGDDMRPWQVALGSYLENLPQYEE